MSASNVVRLQPMKKDILPGIVSDTGWELPSDMTEAEWKSAGATLGKMQRGHSWWVGDWVVFGEHAYGDIKALVESSSWKGPKYQTCLNTASVCRAFETSRRRDVLSFKHHAEIAALPPEEADELLNWCEAHKASTMQLRAEALHRRAQKAIAKEHGTKRANTSAANTSPAKTERAKTERARTTPVETPSESPAYSEVTAAVTFAHLTLTPIPSEQLATMFAGIDWQTLGVVVRQVDELLDFFTELKELVNQLADHQEVMQ